MSVHARKRARGRVVYEVIWREPDGRQRCETFSTRREAEARDRDIRDLRDRGRHDSIDAGSESLAEATERWWVDHVERSVSQSTAKVYASALDLHLMSRMGSVAIRDIQPADVVALQRELREDGVGAAMTQKTLMVLSGIMRHSQLLGRIPANPVGPVRIKLARRMRAIRPLPPETVERMRAHVLTRDRQREAALLSLLAYAGLRPGEAFALRWDCLGDRALIVEHGRADGSLKATNTDRIRTVGLLRAVVEDLDAWRAVAPKDGDGALLFPRRGGGVFSDVDYQNWAPAQLQPDRRGCRSCRGDAVHPAPQLREPAGPGRLERTRDLARDG
jgi:integrase